MPLQKNLTQVLISRPLHGRLKAVVKAKGATIQGFIGIELERIVTREEARKKAKRGA